MPNLEAPISITNDSSTERSLSPVANDEPLFDEQPQLHLQQQQQHQHQHHQHQPQQQQQQQNNQFARGGIRLAALQRHHDPQQALPLPPLMPLLQPQQHVNRGDHQQWIPYPPAVHLLPVTLPPQVAEPTLDEMLRRVTGRNDLHNVDTVHLRVISYTISLSRLSLFLPRLQHLNLSGSVLNSLRDLGLGLVHLNHLNVSNCGLSSADGISTVANAVQVLIADGNMIQRVGPLAELTLLRQLSLRSNRISDLGLLTFLGMCPNLAELDMRGNPVCHLAMYHLTMQRSVRSLQMLDGLAIDDCNADGMAGGTAMATTATTTPDSNSTDGDFSSLSSEVCSEASVSSAAGGNANDSSNLWCSNRENMNISTTNNIHRPATAPHGNGQAGSNQAVRPSSDTIGCVARASFPVVGSVVSWARQQRRQAWISASNSAHSSHSTNSSAAAQHSMSAAASISDKSSGSNSSS